jgi:hypothetical protein
MKSRSFSESHSIPYNKFRALGFLEAPLGRKGAPPWEAVASLAALCAFEAQKQSAKLSQSARLELEHINFPTSEVLKWLDLQ